MRVISTILLALAVAPVAVADSTKGEHLRFSWGDMNERWVAPLKTPALSNITRADVMKRAEEWTAKKIPYCQCNGPEECCGSCPHCGTYRCDCSGYVSYCWNLGTGYTTDTLPEVSYKIAKSELKPGDIMLYEAVHVVLFGGWADDKQTTYYAYQEPGCHNEGPHYAYKSVVPYPMNWNPQDFVPYRFRHIMD